MSTRETVVGTFEQVAAEQGKTLAPLTDSLPLLDTGLDSLCFAIVVARLEDKLGQDPFSASEELEIPLTVGEFIKLYEDAVGA